jgi:acyl-homoserine-lactone acylase
LRQRLFIDPDRLKADYAQSPLWLRKLMQAWADGLNAWLADHPKAKPLVLTHFEPWMALSFSEGSIGGDIERVPLSQLQAFYDHKQVAMTAAERGLIWQEPKGSNGIAIAPSRTKDGHALLLINPHTSFFFRSELQMTSREGLNAYGAVTWGQFFIYQGFNAHAGWMHTSSGIDNVDEFAETVVDSPTGAKGYRYGGQIRPLAKNTITLRYRRPDGTMASRSFTTWASHHGPIVREEGIAFALMNRPVAALEQSYLRTKTRDLSEFLKVAERKANSSNNTLFADDKGEIAYLHPQFVPIRDTRFDYTKPVDGSDPATDWRGLHALDTLPSVLNPKNGWAFNTNNAPWTAAGADSPGKPTTPSIWTNWAKTHVAPMRKRCWASGGTSRCLRLSRLPTIPGFRRSSTFAPLFDAAASDPGNADRQAAIALLKGWDRRWSAGSTATTLAVNWGEALWAKRGDHPDPEDDSTSVWDWMERHASPAQRLAALDEAIARLKGDFGDWRVPWGHEPLSTQRRRHRPGVFGCETIDPNPLRQCALGLARLVRGETLSGNETLLRHQRQQFRRRRRIRPPRHRPRRQHRRGKQRPGLSPFLRSGQQLRHRRLAPGAFLAGRPRRAYDFHPHPPAALGEARLCMVIKAD